jgi:uncharacterized protein (TIGR02147 family)
MAVITERIFEYDNYRTFLADYFTEQKAAKACFSHRYFAQKAGFASSSFCAHVIEGSKNLSPGSIQKVSAAMGLKSKAAQYFEAMVGFAQAESIADKERFFTRMNTIRKGSSFFKLACAQSAFYDEWYYAVIRELAVHCEWHGDYSLLGSLVKPPISADKAEKAVKLLLQLGLISRDRQGHYRQNASVITAAQLPPIVVRTIKKQLIFKALEAEECLEKPAKYSSGMTVAMSQDSYARAKELIDELRQKILVMAMDDAAVDQVFQANFQIFPLSEPIPHTTERTR